MCRSPFVEGLLRRSLDGATDCDGDTWVIASAGTADIDAIVDPYTIDVATRAGIDMSGHRRRTLTADLLVTMSRQHLHHVVAVDPSAWLRTFTLLKLARRASASAPPRDGESFAAWLQRVASHRRASDLIRPDPADDVADPYGGPASEHEVMARRVQAAVTTLVRHGPWYSERSIADNQFSARGRGEA